MALLFIYKSILYHSQHIAALGQRFRPYADNFNPKKAKVWRCVFGQILVISVAKSVCYTIGFVVIFPLCATIIIESISLEYMTERYKEKMLRFKSLFFAKYGGSNLYSLSSARFNFDINSIFYSYISWNISIPGSVFRPQPAIYRSSKLAHAFLHHICVYDTIAHCILTKHEALWTNGEWGYMKTANRRAFYNNCLSGCDCCHALSEQTCG